MKSSCISLLYVPGAGGSLAGADEAAKAAKGMLINLIDSPGHVDFCSEVWLYFVLLWSFQAEHANICMCSQGLR